MKNEYEKDRLKTTAYFDKKKLKAISVKYMLYFCLHYTGQSANNFKMTIQ